MVALRKRAQPTTTTIAPQVEATESPPSENPTPSGALAGAVAEQGGSAAAPASTNELSDRDSLQQRLRELQSAEEMNRERQAQIISAMKIERPQQEKPPEYSARDRQLIHARPGILQDQRFLRMANGLPHAGIPYGTDAFYR